MAVEPFRKPRGQDATAAAQHMQPHLIAERVGDLLGQAREQRGESLADVGKALRIRQPYLEAIEKGEYDALPGLTYAIGFVRAYADYLGLDVQDIVRRYKEEAGTPGAGADLHFPTPLPEGRIPTRAILVLALLLTALAYVGWWWFSTDDRKIADLIPALPSSISNLMDEQAPAAPAPTVDAAPAVTTPDTVSETAPAATEAVESTPPVQDNAPAATPAEQPAVPPEAEAEPATPAPGPVTVAPAPVTVPTAQAPAASMPAPAAAPVTSSTATGMQEPATSAAAAPQRVDAAQEATTADGAESDTAPPDPEPVISSAQAVASAAEASSAPAAPTAAAAAGRVFGAENSGSRIEVTATGDAWVEFRDTAGQLVFTRVLRQGDIYHVPNQPGLRLQTGNAGALAFKVDGATLPPIGPAGSVRRNVLIEPASLQSGGAEGQPAAGGN